MDNEQNHSRKGPMGRGPQARFIGGKAKNFKKSIKKLINYCRPLIPMIIFAIVLAFLSSILSIIGPDKLKDMTNTIIAGISGKIDLDKIKSIALLLVCLYALSFIFNYIQGFLMAGVTQKFSKKLRQEISIKINKLPLRYFDNNSYGDILSRITNDVDTLGQTMNQSIGMLVTSVTMFLGSLVMMVYTNWIMAITAVLATITGFSLMTVILSKSQKYFIAQQRQLGKLNGHIEEMYSGHNVVKAYNGVYEAKAIFKKYNDQLYESAWKSQFLSGLMPTIMGFIGNFGYVAVCIVGALLNMNGSISIGVIVAFMIYIRLFTNPLSQIAQAATSLQSAAAASERVFEFLDEEELEDEKDKTTVLDKNKVKGDIAFEHVKFGYSDDKLIIKDFSAKAKAGQKIAIVGPTGAGKTTLVNLLMRFYEINSGDIKIDGVSTKKLTRENIHDLFCMVLQDTWIFNGSVKENIIYNKNNVTMQDVKNACKTVGIDHFIKTLPNGYDTILSDTESMSSGQKQLITIARGMIENAPFLILDEATSSVDTRTEELVQKAMDKLMHGKTSFIIAHRLSTIKNADLILVMKDGNIIEQGNHDELIRQNGFYAELYNSQFQN